MTEQKPGKTRDFIATEQFAQGVKAALPRLTITGARPGPRAVVTAAQHGRELNGIASIDRVFRQLDPHHLRGEVVFLPIMNPLGVRMGRQDYPNEETRYRVVSGPSFNMNREWIDPDLSTYAGAVAAAAWQQCVHHADLLLDLHGWSGLSLSWAWGSDREWTRTFGLPWHMLKDLSSGHQKMSDDAAFKTGIPVVVAELAPQNLVDLDAVAAGERGILNLLKRLGVIEGKPELPPVQYEFAAGHQDVEILAPADCLVVPEKRLGEIVQAGDLVLRLLSLDTLETIEAVRAREAALVFNIGGMAWGEDVRDRSVIHRGQRAGILKNLSDCEIIRNPRDG